MKQDSISSAPGATLAESILARLTFVKGPDRQGNFSAQCPFHEGRTHGSFSLHLQRGFYCFGCGEKGSVRLLAEKLGVPTGPLTLEQLAEAKGLPVDWLKQVARQGKDGVEITYRDEAGQEKAVRTRLNLTDTETASRFRWRKGDHPCLYGLLGLEMQKAKGYTILVEGESNTWTLWHAGFPALGIPGANTWKPEWANNLSGFPKVYLLVDPDEGGRKLLKSVVADVPGLLAMVPPEGVKDISDLYLADREHFGQAAAHLLETARPAQEILTQLADQEWQANYELARSLLEKRNILVLVVQAAEAQGVVRERKNIALLYLALVSRALRRPVNVKVYGPSSGGKSLVVECVTVLHAPEATYILTSGSERGLVFAVEDFKHRFICYQEAKGTHSGTVAQAILHEVAWGSQVRYLLVDKTAQGLKSRLIEKEGPTGLILTATRPLSGEMESRLFTITVKDTPGQNREVCYAIAARHNGSKPQGVDFTRFHALSRVLARPVQVTIPWGHWLAERVPAEAVAIRRAFDLFLSLVEASAVLHQTNRPRSHQGAIVATVSDYAIARSVAGESLVAVNRGGVTPAQLKAVEAVRQICEEAESASKLGEATIRQVAKRLGIGTEAARLRLQVPLQAELVVNIETRRGQPARYKLGSEPGELEPLPTPEKLAQEFPDLADDWQPVVEVLEGGIILDLGTLELPPPLSGSNRGNLQQGKGFGTPLEPSSCPGPGQPERGTREPPGGVPRLQETYLVGAPPDMMPDMMGGALQGSKVGITTGSGPPPPSTADIPPPEVVRDDTSPDWFLPDDTPVSKTVFLALWESLGRPPIKVRDGVVNDLAHFLATDNYPGFLPHLADVVTWLKAQGVNT